MLAIGLAAVLAALVVYSFGATVNYCGAAMCGMSNAHTFCQYTEGPGPRCSGYIDDRLSGEEKARVIGRMNRRRNEAAQGRLQLPPASNMLKLRWVEELAQEAQIWADQCSPPSYPEEHDLCRDLYSITVGQCVASVVGEAPGLRPESVVDMWYLQGRQNSVSMDDRRYPTDFAQMLWAHTYLVGCARSRFMIEQNGRLRTVIRLVCNFAPRGPEGPMWSSGAPASACPAPSGPDPVLPGLCTFHYNASFTYDVTNATVLKQQSLLEAILEIERNDSLNFHGSLDQIYLTKIMATSIIISQAEQRHQLDSKEKNDIVAAKVLKDTQIIKNVTDDNETVIDDVSAKMANESSTVRVFGKMSTVGRPKSYNLEELNVPETKDSDNGTYWPDIVKEDDGYKDYDVDDILENNEQDYISSVTENNATTEITSVETEGTTDTMVTPRVLSTHNMESTIDISSESEINNATTISYTEVTTTPYVQNDILKRLIDLSEKTDLNPSDPETARQLEEALEHMEKALASQPVSSKVRRDLRSESQVSQPPSDYEHTTKILSLDPTHTQKLTQLSAPDPAPIISILKKYAPLLKSYENIFSRSNASQTTLRLVVFVLGCLVSNSF